MAREFAARRSSGRALGSRALSGRALSGRALSSRRWTSRIAIITSVALSCAGVAVAQAATNSDNSTAPGATGCTGKQLIANPSFEDETNPGPDSSPDSWEADHGSGNDGGQSGYEPAHTGNWDYLFSLPYENLWQDVAVPTGCTSYTLNLWLHIDSTRTTTTKKLDTLTVQLNDGSGNPIRTVATYSNLDRRTGYQSHTLNLNLAKYAGKTVQFNFQGSEHMDMSGTGTYFSLDDVTLNVH